MTDLCLREMTNWRMQNDFKRRKAAKKEARSVNEVTRKEWIGLGGWVFVVEVVAVEVRWPPKWPEEQLGGTGNRVMEMGPAS